MLPALAQNLNIIRTTASFQASVFCNVTQTIYICIYIFIMIRQVQLHVAYNTLCTDQKMQYFTIGWDMASDMQYPVP